MSKDLIKKGVAELVGTFVLVFVACGVAAITSGSLVATALSFGLVIVAMAYSIGNISGCHVNPAVSLGVFIYNKLSKKDGFGWKELVVYVIAQFIGAILGALMLELVLIAVAKDAGSVLGSDLINTSILGSGASGLWLGFLVEVILTFIFVLAVLGVTSKPEYSSAAGIVIGLALTLVHLIGINLTGTSVNPARSFGPALIALINGQTEPIKEIWIFLIAPLIGAALAAVLYWYLSGKKEAKKEASVD